MSTKPVKVRASMLDRLRRSFQSKDEAGFEEAMTAVEEATAEEEAAEEQAALASAIAEAVATAIAPIVERVDAVDAYITDRKTRDDEAAAKQAEAAEAARKAATDRKGRGRDSAPADMGISSDPVGSGGGGSSDVPVPPTSAAGATDNEALAAFLKAKGLSDEDVAEACKMLGDETKDEAEVGGAGGAAAGEASPDATSGEPDAGVTAPLYNAGASSQLDSAGLVTEFRDTVARAEILAPGVKLPTFDAKATSKKTADSICALRRAALKQAFDSAERKKHVTAFVTDAAVIGKMSCDTVRMAFIGASEAAKASNAVRPTRDAATTPEASIRASIADMNKQNRDFWKRG